MRIGWIHILLVIAIAALMFVRLHNAGGAALLGNGKTALAAVESIEAVRDIRA
ncbi:MAG: hypothetical protein HY852_14635 [Bradyrhizobium sp.]|uniref:hypothetical protein n=1 Tax=Bradyrhizobium sp. TaxID=376 RepID=UPI0025BCE8EF|nr:hypothetical protein [Bradyrhizobium sp.]MBI5263044.1 hypothetical protein [Bradyrhizobium sp.]